jgi:hypothetical protein
MAETTNPLAHLGDALIILVAIIALAAGLDVKWIVLGWLCLELISKVCKAFVGVLNPLIKTYRGAP